MNRVFEGHPLIILALGLFAAPLLMRQLRYLTLRRGAWVLLFAGILLGLLSLALRHLPVLANAMPSGLALWPWLSAWLVTGLVVLALLQRASSRHDAGLGELLLSIPSMLFCVFLSPLDPQPPWLSPGVSSGLLPAFCGLVGVVLLGLLTGGQEKYRLNQAPRSLEGLPFRLLMLSLILLLWLGFEAMMAGLLP